MSMKKKLKRLLAGKSTVDQLQGEFNQLMFQLGNATYKKHLMSKEAARVSNDVQLLINQAEKLTDAAAKLPRPPAPQAQPVPQPLPVAKE